MKLLLALFLLSGANCSPHPHLYNPYYNLFRYNAPYYGNYASQMPHYSQYIPTTSNLIEDNVAAAYLATPNHLPTLNILAELPYTISNRFTVVPMLVVGDNNMRTFSNAEILAFSKKKPIMTVRVQEQSLQCTPAVRIILEEPIIVYSLKTSILFPSEIQVLHGGLNIPIQVGAVLAPVPQDTFVSTDSPISLDVVYAVPTKPIHIDYVNTNDVIIVPDNQAVIVETGSVNLLPPKNVTVLNFPDREAEPTLLVDEEDDELVNRNPPLVLAPAGIVQSTQPQSIIEPFTNSKESAVLIALREEAKKRI